MPTPREEWMRIFPFVSWVLKPFPIPAAITTGNSRPLLLWMLMMRTVSAFSSLTEASP